MHEEQQSFLGAWHDRLAALRNIPPVLKIVWQSGPAVVTFSMLARVVVSIIPVGVLAVASRIIGIISDISVKHQPAPPYFWQLVAVEFGLAILGAVAARIISFLDTL